MTKIYNLGVKMRYMNYTKLCQIILQQQQLHYNMIPKEKLQWTEKDSEDAKVFVSGVKDGSIKTMNFLNLKRA